MKLVLAPWWDSQGPRAGFGIFYDRFPQNLIILFNNVNLASPIGIITSPHFDQSIALAGGPFSTSDANRRIDLQVQFSF